MRELGIAHDVRVYPDSGDSFINDHVGTEAPGWSVVMGRLWISNHHESSAIDARRRIIRFFDTHLES